MLTALRQSIEEDNHKAFVSGKLPDDHGVVKELVDSSLDRNFFPQAKKNKDQRSLP